MGIFAILFLVLKRAANSYRDEGIRSRKVLIYFAEVAHLVEHDLAKVGVAGSSPVFRSRSR